MRRVEEDAIRIAVRDAAHRHVALLGQRVLQVGGRNLHLAHRGHGLEADRAGRIVGIHQRRVVRRDAHVELGLGLGGGARRSSGVTRMTSSSCGERRDALALLPVPVVPQALRDTLPDECGPGRERERTCGTGRTGSADPRAARLGGGPLPFGGRVRARPRRLSGHGRGAMCPIAPRAALPALLFNLLTSTAAKPHGRRCPRAVHPAPRAASSGSGSRPASPHGLDHRPPHVAGASGLAPIAFSRARVPIQASGRLPVTFGFPALGRHFPRPLLPAASAAPATPRGESATTRRSDGGCMSWHERFPGVSEVEWRDWRWQHRHALRTAPGLAGVIALTDAERRGLAQTAAPVPRGRHALLRVADGPAAPVLPGADAGHAGGRGGARRG